MIRSGCHFLHFRPNFRANRLGTRVLPQFSSLPSKCMSVCAHTRACEVLQKTAEAEKVEQIRGSQQEVARMGVGSRHPFCPRSSPNLQHTQQTMTRKNQRNHPVHLQLLGDGSTAPFIGVHAVPGRLPELLRYPGESAQAFSNRALHHATGTGAFCARLMYASEQNNLNDCREDAPHLPVMGPSGAIEPRGVCAASPQ